MDKALCINRLYAWVLHKDMETNNISVEDIIKGIEHMKVAYNHKTSNLASNYAEAADFTSPAFRCAYLHKYAPIHTVLVSEIVDRVVYLHYNYFYDLIISSGCVNVCSLGGGPGSDIVGIVLSLHNAFGPFKIFTSVIDCMPHWNATLNSLISETQQGTYGKLRTYFNQQYFDWRYIGANLLEDNYNNKVTEAISSADIINMIKFVSAAVCVDTPSMIKRIFSLMKPGAVVFFVDNSVGDVKHILTRTAEECELEPLYGPISHEHYINRLVETTRFGYSSCFQTKIAIQVWVKPHRPVQTWQGSPVQAWTPFGLEKNKQATMNLESTPIQEPFCNVSKSLLLTFDETELDDSPDSENPLFCSDEIECTTPARNVIFRDQNCSFATPGFPGNFQKPSLSSTPNLSDSLLSSPSNLNPSPSIYNINYSYSSPMPFRNRMNSNFQVDSGCWSGSSSLNTADSFNDVDYRKVELPANELSYSNYNTNSWNSPAPNRLNYFNERNRGVCNSEWRSPVEFWNAPNEGKVRYDVKNWYENRENMPNNCMNFAAQNQFRGNQSSNWKNVNSENDFSKAPSRFANRNDRRFNPYRNRVNRI